MESLKSCMLTGSQAHKLTLTGSQNSNPALGVKALYLAKALENSSIGKETIVQVSLPSKT